MHSLFLKEGYTLTEQMLLLPFWCIHELGELLEVVGYVMYSALQYVQFFYYSRPAFKK